MQQPSSRAPFLICSALCVALLASGCGSGRRGETSPSIEARAKSVLTNTAGQRFKDSNGNGTLDPYEDWRLSAVDRADDLQSRMTMDEKTGMMQIDTLNAPEDPCVDAHAANSIVGKNEFRQRALDAQRKSIVLLKNQDDNALPLRTPTTERPVRLYTLGLDEAVVGDARYGGYSVVVGDRSPATGNKRAPVPKDTDYVMIRVEVINPTRVTSIYRSEDHATGGRINPSTRRAWGADDPDKIDNGLRFGGAFPWEADILAFSQMATAQSWQITPSLPDIQAAMKEVGNARKVILCIYFRQPYVLDDDSHLKNAGGIVATFGVSDDALMDVLTGKFKPQGKLPFALANKPEAIGRQEPDAPGYAADDTLYPFGFGLTY